MSGLEAADVKQTAIRLTAIRSVGETPGEDGFNAIPRSRLTESEDAVSGLTSPEVGGTTRRWRRGSSSTGRSRCRKRSVSAASSTAGRRRRIIPRSSWIACSKSTSTASSSTGRARGRWAFVQFGRKGVPLSASYEPLNIRVFLFRFLPLQDGDVIELCQVSDIRAGGVPKVRQCSVASMIATTQCWDFLKSRANLPRRNLPIKLVKKKKRKEIKENRKKEEDIDIL